MPQIWAEYRVLQQPSVKFVVAFRIQDGCKDKEGRCGQKEEDDADCSQYNKIVV